MDPLSITASVVALMSVVAQTTKILTKIVRLRDAPNQFVQLSLEVGLDLYTPLCLRRPRPLHADCCCLGQVSDIRAVLVYMSDAAAEFDALGSSPDSPAQRMILLLEKAKITLDDITTIVTTKILVVPSKLPDGRAEVSKTGWFRYQRKVQTLLEELRRTRKHIHYLISTHTA